MPFKDTLRIICLTAAVTLGVVLQAQPQPEPAPQASLSPVPVVSSPLPRQV